MSRPLTSINAWSDHYDPMARINYSMLQLALVGAGYDEDRYSVLAPVCNPHSNLETECRKVQWVQVYINALALGVDLDSIPNIETCEYLTGVNPQPSFSGSFASLTTALTGANNDLVFTAKERGNDGNLISVAYVVAGNDTPLSIGVVGNAITINVATDGVGAATSTAAQIRSLVAGNAAASALVGVEFAPSNTGAGIVTAMAQAYLTGGSNG